MSFDAIRAWAVDTIRSVPGANKVYGGVRIIQSDEELEQDFGLGEPPEGELQQRTHGWTVTIRSREPEEHDHANALQTYALQATCYNRRYR